MQMGRISASLRLQPEGVNHQTSEDFRGNRLRDMIALVEPVTDIRSFALGLVVLVLPR
jgi:hypothetical protein